MSRIAKMPIKIPSDVKVEVNKTFVKITGKKGDLVQQYNDLIKIDVRSDWLYVVPLTKEEKSLVQAGTLRSLINNMIIGVSSGFERKLIIVGVGYRAQVKENVLSLSLGYSHLVEYFVPDKIVVETPGTTEIVVRGADKQKVGQVAAEIRAYRPPDPYKGKGIRYSDERILSKEAKKK